MVDDCRNCVGRDSKYDNMEEANESYYRKYKMEEDDDDEI